MKLSIEKAADAYRIEVTTDTAKKPLVIQTTQAQLEVLVRTLETARGMDRLKLSLEL